MKKSLSLQTSELPETLERIHQEVCTDYGKGKVADYIPALQNVRPD